MDARYILDYSLLFQTHPPKIRLRPKVWWSTNAAQGGVRSWVHRHYDGGPAQDSGGGRMSVYPRLPARIDPPAYGFLSSIIFLCRYILSLRCITPSLTTVILSNTATEVKKFLLKDIKGPSSDQSLSSYSGERERERCGNTPSGQSCRPHDRWGAPCRSNTCVKTGTRWPSDIFYFKRHTNLLAVTPH